MNKVLMLLVGLTVATCNPAVAKTETEEFAATLCSSHEVRGLADLMLFSATKVLSAPKQETNTWVDVYQVSAEGMLDWVLNNTEGDGSEDLVYLVNAIARECSTDWVRNEFLVAKTKYGKEPKE